MTQSQINVHFLHAHRGLDLLVRPPVRHAGMMTWDFDGGLWVIDGEGALQRVHPVLGTQVIDAHAGGAWAIAVLDDGYLLVSKDGKLRFYDHDHKLRNASAHRFCGEVSVVRTGAELLLVGLTETGLEAVTYVAEKRTMRVALPDGAVVLTGEKPVFAWYSDAGLERVDLSLGRGFEGGKPERERLIATHGDVLVGVGQDSVLVWQDASDPVRVSIGGVLAADATAHGETILLADRQGGVSMLDGRGLDQSPLSIRAGDGPIDRILIDRSGDYVATSGESVRIWSVDR